MRLVHKIHPRFPTGPSTTLDMPLDSGFVSGTTIQDRSQASNHGTAGSHTGIDAPALSYPGFSFSSAHHSSASYVFNENDGAADSIDVVGGGFTAAGFASGMAIRVGGSDNAWNDGEFNVAVKLDTKLVVSDGDLTQDAQGKIPAHIASSSRISTSSDLGGGAYPYTMAIWAKPSEVSSERAIFAIGDSTTGAHQTIKIYGTESYSITGKADGGTAGAVTSSNNTAIADTWTCIVAVCSGNGSSNWSIYINGVLDNATVSVNEDIDAATESTGQYAIGDVGNNGSTEGPWSGYVGDIMFERRAWSGDEVEDFVRLTAYKYGIALSI